MLDREAWDDAYANLAHIPGGPTWPARWSAAAEAFRAALEGTGRLRRGLRWGDGARHWFDLVLPEGRPRGLVVFVHGGYWLRFDPAFWTHLAAGPVARGRAVALPAYDLCPQVRIGEITRQVARAIAAAAAEVDGPIALAGHSAGGHLVARMLEPGLLPPEVAARLGVVVPISPLADLAPLMHTSMNAQLKIDAAEARAESPVNMTRRLDVPASVRVGSLERPVFLEDAARLARLWRTPLDVAPGRHHFDVIEALEDPDSPLVERLSCDAAEG